MKRTKPLLALALAAVMALSLAGCGTLMTDSVGALVQGNLDELYLGQYNEDFLQLVDITEAEAEQNYLDGLDVEAQFFAQYFLIENLTDDIKAEIVDLYKEIYSHSRYEVGEATEVDEDTYGVPVTIYPIDIMQSLYEEAGAALDSFNASYSDEEIASIQSDTDAFAEYDAAWAELIIGMCRDELSALGYMEPEEMVIQVTRGSDGLWTIADNDFQRIDAAIIYYP